MHHLIYLSSATGLFDRDQLQELLRVSRSRNEANGITGLLVYNDGTFLQAIEGEQGRVLELFNRISRDQRHRKIMTLFNEWIPAREFGDWTMAYRDIELDPDLTLGFNALLNQASSGDDMAAYPTKVRAFLRNLLR